MYIRVFHCIFYPYDRLNNHFITVFNVWAKRTTWFCFTQHYSWHNSVLNDQICQSFLIFRHPIMICMKKLLVFQTPISKIVLLCLVNPTWFCFTWLCSWLLLFIKVCRNHMLLMKIYNYPSLIWVNCVCRFIPQNSTLLKFTAASR